jgi:hypothetical protein
VRRSFSRRPPILFGFDNDFFCILSGIPCLGQRDGKDSFPEFRLDLVAVDFAGYAYGSGKRAEGTLGIEIIFLPALAFVPLFSALITLQRLP